MPDFTSTYSSIFVDCVKDVLENLYDFAFLEHHPFAVKLSANHARTGETRGQCLRRLMLSAVERMNPGTGISLRAVHARAYNMLHLRYVEGMTTHEASNEIGVSKRQGYRLLASAREDLAVLLQSLYPELADNRESSPAVLSDVKASAQPVNISTLVQYAEAAVARLAAQNGLTVTSTLPQEPVMILTDSTIAKQVLVSILSRCVQQAEYGSVTLTLQSEQPDWVLSLSFRASSCAEQERIISSVTKQLVGGLGWSIDHEQVDELCTISLHLESKVVTLLVIDDDEGLGELVERYLTGQPYRIAVARSGEEGLRFASRMRPDVVVLDVMMPQMDGWEVLQRLRAKPETRDIDIVICSIFNDPELAYSLGAAYVLGKPLAQADFLEALRILDLTQQ
jgi:CheY-like chemotaxis protein